MMDRLKLWWGGLAPREHALLAMAAGLSAFLFLLFVVFLPMFRAHNVALASVEAKTEDYILVQRGVATLQASAPTVVGPASSIDDFRLVVTETAAENNVSITRLQSVQGGGLQIILDLVDPTTFYAWLEELSAFPGGQVVVATIEGREEGKVRAVVELLAVAS